MLVAERRERSCRNCRFGTGAPVILPDGKRKRPHLFRIVLSHSRKAYSEVVYRQTAEAYIRCLENAFWHFGRVPKLVSCP